MNNTAAFLNGYSCSSYSSWSRSFVDTSRMGINVVVLAVYLA